MDKNKNNEMIGTYSVVRKSMKWTRKEAFHFIEEDLVNAQILYKKNGGYKHLLRFKLDCITSLLSAGGVKLAAPNASDCFSGHNFPELIPPTECKQNPQKRCVVCFMNKKRKESQYQCADCENRPGLCPAPCLLTLNELTQLLKIAENDFIEHLRLLSYFIR